MATIDEHMKDCKKFIDKSFEDVHKFLDQYAEVFPISVFYDYHRSFLHNSYGLSVIYSRGGEKALRAGQIHLVRDYLEGPMVCVEDVDRNLNRCLLQFNDMNNFKLQLKPSLLAAWKGEGMVSVAFSNRGE